MDKMFDQQFPNFNVGSFYGAPLVDFDFKSTIFTTDKTKNPKFQVINPEQSLIELYKTLIFLRNFKTPPRILFLNTISELNELVKTTAISTNQYYINTKWVGGTLTNWSHVSKSIRAFSKFERKWGASFSKSVKEGSNLTFPKIRKWRNWFSGFAVMPQNQPFVSFEPVKKPLQSSLLTREKLQNVLKNQSLETSSSFELQKNSIIADPVLEKPEILIILGNSSSQQQCQYAIREANLSQIPVIGFVETDTSIKGLTFAIPSNNQNFDFLHFCFNWIGRVCRSF